MASAVSNSSNQEDSRRETSFSLSTMIAKMEIYIELIKQRALSTIIVPLCAISASLILTGHFSILRDWMLVPTVKFIFTILGTTLGIGLGLGLATHVHDCLESWQDGEEQDKAAQQQQGARNNNVRSTSQGMLLRSNTQNYQDETSYAAFMSSAGYDVSDGLLRGQIVKSQSSVILQRPNYEYTHVSEEEQYGPTIMKQQWPHLPSCISHEIGRWMEHIVRDYVAIWYTMIDPSCPYQDEQEYRKQQQEKVATSEVNESTNNENGATDVDSQSSQQNTTTTNSTATDREMVFTLSPHRSRPLMTAMYHSLALVLGNLSSRMEHVNVFSLLLLKFTKVLALKLKTFRELRVLALEKRSGGVGTASAMMSSSTTTTTASSPTESLQHDHHDSTMTFDEHGNKVSNTRRKKRRPVSEMTMAKEFLLAGKLHKAITFGMDVPSLLFADADGKECLEDWENLSQEQILERRLLDSNMMSECEADYNRVLGHRLCRALLPRSEFSSPIIRTIMTELLGTCLLSPIMGCFAPDYVNSWISTGLEAVVVANKNTAGESNGDVGVDNRTWDYDESTNGLEVEMQLDAVFPEEDGDEDGLNEAIEVIRNSTDPDDEEENGQGLNVSGESEHDDLPGHDSQTVSGDYILPLLTMAVIDLQRYVDFDLIRDESVDPGEIGTNWDNEECQDAVRQLVLVIEAALIHGRRRQRLTKRKPSTADDKDHEGDTLLPFFSSNLSQVLMELTSDIDAFETRIAVQETRLKNDDNGEAKKSDGPSTSCQPSMSELSTLRTLIAAWLHTGQVYKMLSVLIQARQSILVPYFNDDAFLRNSENASGFVCQLKALDGVEMMVDTSSILSSSTLDANGKASVIGKSSPQKKRLGIQASSPTGGNSTSQPSPRLMGASLSQSMAKSGERLHRFISGGSMVEEPSEYGTTASTSMSALSSTTVDGPTPRYLDFHRNQNFALSLRTERERRKESWQHVSASMADQSLKIVHKVKGSTEEDMEDHRDLHRLSRTFYSGTNSIGLKDGTRRKDPEADDAKSSDAEAIGQDAEGEAVRVSLLTVEMVGSKRRIEIPDDDSSFLIRAQPRPLNAVGMHIDQRNHGQTYKTFAATYEEAALPSGSFRYSGGRYIRRCMLKYYPNDRTATIELPTSEAARTLDSRKVKFGPPTQISVGPPKARPLSGDFLRKHHLCQKWVPRGAAPRSGSSILASPTMESSDFHSVPRAGKSIDFVYRMSLFEPPMVELSGKKFTVHDSSVLGAHRADASSMELSDASLSVALLTAGQDWEHQLSQQDDDPSRNDGTNGKNTDPGVEMGPDGYPIVWIKLHKKQGEQITTEIKPYRASYMRAALLLSSARQEAQRQCLVMCVKAGSARNATRARVDSLLKPTQRLLEFATSTSREKQSVLMRDLKLGINHVDREQLRRNKLLYPRHPTNIRSLSATIEGYMPAKDTGITFPGSSPTTTVYKVRCIAIVELVDTEDDEVDLSDYDSADGSRASVFREEWVVYRQFRDFNTLHKHLKTQVAVNETSGTASSRLVGAATAAFTVGGAPTGAERHRKGLIPSLGQANKAGALGLTQKAIEKRCTILHSYLQHFMASNHPLRHCTEILTFLGAFHPFPAGVRTGEAPSETPDGLGRVGMVRTVFGEVLPSEKVVVPGKTERIIVSSPQKSVDKKLRSFSAASDTMSSPSLDERGSVRSKSTRLKPEEMAPAIKAKIDKVPLGKVRQAIFELIRSQFDFENASFFRNRLLTAIKTMSFAVATNGEFRKTLYNTHTTYLNPEAIADLIKMGLDMLWPDGIFFTSSPQLTPEQSLELSEKAKDLLMNAFPDQLRSILGNEITDDGLEMLHEMLQNRVVLKSLFYMFVDLLLLEVFPEFQDFLTGGAALDL